ncbi:hypothetical protein BDU57DRAFT_518081 [Ampelomyces quisqualis]|uniref:Uncharacterized protein n=1 Tax=Ampelomyces quisqualis TaxID=50730 RepID=A0A6A5QL78_AMPQU|nr:hypothetical protein BDU57DRAFT_518081 [Ampelomyces quisqualis]
MEITKKSKSRARGLVLIYLGAVVVSSSLRVRRRRCKRHTSSYGSFKSCKVFKLRDCIPLTDSSG